MALGAGAVYAALQSMGQVAEILAPAMSLRFQITPDPQVTLASLTMANWLYHFSEIAAAVMVAAASVAFWRTNALPRWFAVVGGVVALLGLLHLWLALPAALARLIWIVAVAVARIVTASRSPRPTGRPAADSQQP